MYQYQKTVETLRPDQGANISFEDKINRIASNAGRHFIDMKRQLVAPLDGKILSLIHRKVFVREVRCQRRRQCQRGDTDAQWTRNDRMAPRACPSRNLADIVGPCSRSLRTAIRAIITGGSDTAAPHTSSSANLECPRLSDQTY